MSSKKLKQENIEAGRRVKLVREDRSMTQEAFAEEIGISPSALKKIESGENGVSSRVLRKLLQMNISSDYILRGKTEAVEEIITAVNNSSKEDRMRLFLMLLVDYTKDSPEDKLTKEQVIKLLSDTIDRKN